MKVTGGISVWTSMPWTISTNKALSVNPNENYVIAYQDKSLLIFAETTTNHFINATGTKTIIIAVFKGHYIKHIKFQQPLSKLNKNKKRKVNIIFDASIRSLGTGVVHLSPVHSFEDYFQFRKNSTETLLNSISKVGAHKNMLTKRCKRLEASVILLSWLKMCGLLISIRHVHSKRGYCWRHKTEISLRASSQWFINLNSCFGVVGLRDTSIKQLKRIGFGSKEELQLFTRMIISRPDWVISRQRLWGVPISVFINNRSKRLHPMTHQVLKAISSEINLYGIEVWQPTLIQNFKRCTSKEYMKSFDVLDVWFDSGTIWNLMKRDPHLSFPADLFVEGRDQFRGWFLSSTLTSLILNGIPPVKNIRTHGFVVDKESKKISKSMKNYVDLTVLVDSQGADIIRMWVTLTDYTKDITMTPEAIENTKRQYLHLRNTLKFILTNVVDFCYLKDCVPVALLSNQDLNMIDDALSQQVEYQQTFTYGNYRVLLNEILRLCSEELGKCYFSTVKERLYVYGRLSFTRKSTQTALLYILRFIVKLLSPVISFTTEEVWQYITKTKDSIFKSFFQSLPSRGAMNLSNYKTISTIKHSTVKTIEAFRCTVSVKANQYINLTLSCHLHQGSVLISSGWELRLTFGVTRVKVLHTIKRGMKTITQTKVKCKRCWQILSGVCWCVNRFLCLKCKEILQISPPL
jgi:isoleucyl-tRNA synthetase